MYKGIEEGEGEKSGYFLDGERLAGLVEASVVLYRVDRRDFEDIDESNDVVTEWMRWCGGVVTGA